MDCSAAALGLLLLVVAPLALAAFLRSRANAARLAGLAAELALLREIMERALPAEAATRAATPAAGSGAMPAAPRSSTQAAVPAPPSSATTGSCAPPLAAPAPPAGAAPARPGALTSPGISTSPVVQVGVAVPASPGAPMGVTARPSAAAPAGATAGRTTFEELVGARLLVWVGAMALALAGAFLVKISFERGWISPPIRVAIGVGFGIGLLALGESLRRSSGRISEALSAAGIADLFACFLAAVHLYHLVPPAAGFLLMGLTTAVAVALALRQGVMVALLGLSGGFLTPALIQTGQPSARNLFGYLLLLTAGLLAVAWRRRWRWLAAAALAAGLLWVAVWLAGPFHGGDAPWLSLFLIALAVSATLPPVDAGAGGSEPSGLSAASDPSEPSGRSESGGPASPTGRHRDAAPSTLAIAAIAATLILLAVTVSRSGYSQTEWGFLGLLAAGMLALAWLDPRYLPLTWVAAATTAALLTARGWEVAPTESTRYLLTVLAGGGLFALAGWAAALAGRPKWRRPSQGHPGQWASLSAASGVVFFLAAWSSTYRGGGLGRAAWGGLALAEAALYLAGAVPVARRRRAHPALTPALAALAVAVTSLVSIAVPLSLHRTSIAAAWALEVAALVWLAGRFCLPALVVLARLLAPAAVLGAFFSRAHEHWMDWSQSPPVWSELLYAYGLPLLALAGAAWLARRDGPLVQRAERGAGSARAASSLASPLRLAAELEWLSVALGFALVTLEIHELFPPPTPTLETIASIGLLELAQVGVIANAWLLLGWVLLRANRRPGRRSLELAGRLVILLGLAAVLAGPGLAFNPLWSHQTVGGRPLLNVLAVAYALPAMLAVAAGAEVRRHGGRRLPPLAGAAALLLGFAWISLTVRQLFHGAFLDAGPADAAERYAYSAAWVLYGVGLLLAGIARRGPILRYGSLAVMLLAVAKVFLYDTARLSDLYRVLSFLGLGASLLLLGFLYQRFVFRSAGSDAG
jgi:uncharacterized membrane protein